MRAGGPQRRLKDPVRLYPVIGAVGIVVLLVVFAISYTANSGLPLERTYRVEVSLPNAQRLLKNNEVRVFGVRAGRIESVAPERTGMAATRARLRLVLDRDVGPLRTDTTVTVRPASVLGTNYLDLVPGTHGRVLASGATLPIRRDVQTVELTDLLDVFDRSTAHAVQDTVSGIATGVAARGTSLNRTLSAVPSTLEGTAELSATLAAPGTRLGPFISGLADTTAALRPVADELARVLVDGSTTLGALTREREALERTIAAVPPTEQSVTTALRALEPALRDLALTADDLAPAVELIPRAVPAATAVVRSARPALGSVGRFSPALRRTFIVLGRTSRAPSTRATLQHAGDTVVQLGRTIETLLPAQQRCNVLGLWARNFSSTFGSLGTGNGPALANIGVTHLGADNEILQNERPSPNVGINYLPKLSDAECESGNEPYDGRQVLGNPKGLQRNTTRDTRQPAGVADRARRVGLLDVVEEDR